jgi:hypothetical protein
LYGSIAVGQTVSRPAVGVLNPKYDFWRSPATDDGQASTAELHVPANFFGAGSDAIDQVVELIGEPFGRGAGPHKPAGADTTIYRNRDPQFPPGGYPKTAAPVTIRVFALSMVGTAPITVTYGGQNPELWGLQVGLSDSAPQPGGILTATMDYDNGGTFSSFLPVLPKYTFTRWSDGTERTLDAGAYGLASINLESNDTPWVYALRDASGSVEPNKFHPGVVEYFNGIYWQYQLWRIRELRALDEHNAELCLDCEDPWLTPHLEEIEGQIEHVGVE